jgi:type III restriction enzyme
MGSRSFYEGWDSNRPNVINFVNIGTGTEAKKFILQSIGRGVRIEPLKNKRKRLLPLYNSKEVDEALFNGIKKIVTPVESLFIFGTNKNALGTVIEHLGREGRKGEQQQLALFLNEAVKGRTLLIPSYKPADKPLAERRKIAKFEITTDEIELLKRYVKFLGDDRVILAIHNTEPSRIRVLHQSLSSIHEYYRTNGHSFKNIGLLTDRVLDYFRIVPEDFENLKELQNEIRHFRHIRVALKDISELSEKIQAVHNFEDPNLVKADLKGKFQSGEITLDEYTEGIERAAHMVREETVKYEEKKLKIKHIANHYYITTFQ